MNALASTVREGFELHLVGDGPLKKDLMAYASSLPVGTRISWHPWCDRATLRNHFRSSHCLLNPSLYEGMPNVVLEGMACGLPVIASRVIGNEEVVRDGVTGFLFSLTDPRGLQQALSAALRRRDLVREMGEAARQWTEEHFSWSQVARQYLELFGCCP
jgi:glycosyltransferase involved in cell wall biosynthesis